MNGSRIDPTVDDPGNIRPIDNIDDSDHDGGEAGQAEEEFGVRNPRTLLDPQLPSQKEIDEHCLTHLPYRNWCPHCVAGKGKMGAHHKQPNRTDGLVEVHFDYAFMSTKGEGLETILVAKERASKMGMATVVPMKGGSIEFPAKRILAFLKEIGLENADIVMKSDQENAIADLLNVVSKRRAAASKMEGVTLGDAAPPVARTIHEMSPVADSQANGFIERGIQDMEGQVRTIKSDFESRTGEKIPSNHDFVPWMVEYAAVLLNRAKVAEDGKTSYERLKGKPASLPGHSLGERIHWRSSIPAKNRRFKMDGAWHDGVFLGLRAVSGEKLVGTKEGVFRAREVRRVPLESRWKDNLIFVKGLPWCHNDKHDAGEEVMLDLDPPAPSMTPATTLPPPRGPEDMQKDLRGFYVKDYDLDPAKGGIGFTEGCKGCLTLMFGGSRVAHENHCRLKIIRRAATDPKIAARVKTTIDRENKWLAEKLEMEEEPKRKIPGVLPAGVLPEMAQDGGVAAPNEEAEQLPKRRRAGGQEVDEGAAPSQLGGSSSSSAATGRDAPAGTADTIPESIPEVGIPASGYSSQHGNFRVALRSRDIAGDDEAPQAKRRMIGEVIEVGLMQALEVEEEKSLRLNVIKEWGPVTVPMWTCEEDVDISFLRSDTAADLSDAIACTSVGEVRHTLDRRLRECMLAELCEEEDGDRSGDVGASIFDYNSPMGVIPDESGDYWHRGPMAATWTRFITVPRRDAFYPNEGEHGPNLATLRNTRVTIPSKGPQVKDDWRKEAAGNDLTAPVSDELWVGRCIFYETWNEASESEEISRVDPVGVGGRPDLPADLVFTDIPEYSLVDDLSKEWLDGSMVTIAKREELTEIYRRKVWTEAQTEECFKITGKPPIPVRWVSTNKGDQLHPNIRCRLVAKHLAAKYGMNAEDLFAAMPPFELVKALLVKAVQRPDREKTIRKVTFLDVSKAHLYAPVGKEVNEFVALPPECSKPGVCGRLNFWLYGMRPASHGWEQEYTKQLVELGFKAGEASPCCFYRESGDVSCVVHGDDFTMEGPPEALKQITVALQKVWLVKVRATLGPEAGDDKEVSILNRIVRWAEDALLYEADPRHVEKLLRDAGLENCKPVTTPGVKEPTSTERAWFEGEDHQKDNWAGHREAPAADVSSDGSPFLDRAGMRDYRSAVARCNYLAADRLEIAFTTKELCRAMSNPTEADARAVARLCRFLKGMPRVVQRIPFADYLPTIAETYVDSDWAGCRKTRKSTSGGVIYLGGVAVRGWSSSQAVIALSSGEAEYYAALKGASAALGFQSMLRDLGMKVSIRLYTDSSAARGIIHRAGLGKLRHLETGYLWLQAAVRQKRLQVRKVLGVENPADLMTKHLATAAMEMNMERLGMAPEEGRSSAVPQVT